MVTSFSSACLFSQLSDESEEEVVEDDGALQTYNTRDMYGDRWPLCQETSLAKKMKRHLKNDKKRTSWRDGHQEAVCGGFGPRFDLVSDLVFFSTNRLKSPNHWHVVT